MLIYLIIPPLIAKSVIHAVLGLILLSIITEIASVLIFLFFLPKKIALKKNDLKPSLTIAKDIIGISAPTVSSRLIGNIGFFLEPIILTNILLYAGYSMNYILNEYGITDIIIDIRDTVTLDKEAFYNMLDDYDIKYGGNLSVVE